MTSSSLAQRIAHFAKHDGITETAVQNINLFRASAPEKAQPVVYDPCIIIVGQGQKCGYLGDRQFVYNPDNFLVMSLPLPCVCEIVEASEDKPFLALCIKIDVTDVSDLMMEMDMVGHPNAHSDRKEQESKVAMSSPMQGAIGEAADRILASLGSTDDAKMLVPMHVKELMFHILKGEQGDALRAVTRQNSRFHQIARAMRFMQENYLENISVDDLAELANMSPSSFHQHFKSVTSVSPVQYLKSIRLHQARSLILQGGSTASSAAASVGYVSGSQFSREYKRFFGVVPSSDRERMS